MASQFEVEAQVRHVIGKGASRRLRREEKLPGVIYGAGKPTLSLTLEHNKIARALEREAFYSHILSLKVGSETEQVILKDVQRHPFKPRILHIDFQRIRADEKLHMNVPLHFTGADRAPGVKAGGIVSHIMNDVEIACLPADLPEHIDIDVSNLDVGDSLHLSNITLPKGVEIVALAHGNDSSVVSIHMPRIVEEEVEEGAPTSAEVPAIEQSAEEPKEQE